MSDKNIIREIMTKARVSFREDRNCRTNRDIFEIDGYEGTVAVLEFDQDDNLAEITSWHD